MEMDTDWCLSAPSVVDLMGQKVHLIRPIMHAIATERHPAEHGPNELWSPATPCLGSSGEARTHTHTHEFTY